MIHEKIYFDESDERVWLDTYAVCDPVISPRDTVLVIPGGGYRGVSAREGRYTALALLGRGINAFVLKYSTGEAARYPRQLLDAAKALKYIKENAEKYNVNKDRIFALGYSAGGHLLGTLATKHGFAEKQLGLPENYLKVRGAIFCYPVVTAHGPTHEGSFLNLMKKPLSEYTDAERDELSIELCVNSETPPAFIWHTSEDKSVPIDGSLKLCLAYKNAGLPVELHIYPYGPHGAALGTDYTSDGKADHIQPRVVAWLDEALKWMKDLDNGH